MNFFFNCKQYMLRKQLITFDTIEMLVFNFKIICSFKNKTNKVHMLHLDIGKLAYNVFYKVYL